MTVSAPVRDLLQLALGSFPRSQEERDRSRALLRCAYRGRTRKVRLSIVGNARPMKTDIRIKELAPYLHDLLGDVTKKDAKALARIVKRGVERRWKDSSVARAIVRSTKIDPDRAKVIARTEMSRARTDVGLGRKRDSDKVVFTIGNKDRACPICRKLAGKVYTVRKAAGVIPRHPNCFCFWSDAPKGARVSNVFCATGEGGGVDPGCEKSGSRKTSMIFMVSGEDVDFSRFSDAPGSAELEIDKTAPRAFQKWQKSITERELQSYGAWGVGDLVGSDRQELKDPGEQYVLEQFKGMVDRAPKTYDGIAYRGVNLPPESLSELKVGGSIDVKGLTSFASDRSVAERYSTESPLRESEGVPVLLEGSIKGGVEIGRMSKGAAYKGENGEISEVLIDRGTLKIKAIRDHVFDGPQGKVRGKIVEIYHSENDVRPSRPAVKSSSGHPHSEAIESAMRELESKPYRGKLDLGARIAAKLYKDNRISLSGAEVSSVLKTLVGNSIAGPLVVNVFCATGEGGGVDPSCGADGSKGSRVGAKFASMPSGKATSKESKKWRKDNQKNYDEDPEFRAVADSVALYTQGDYNVQRAFAQRAVTGRLPAEYEDSAIPGWVDKKMHGSALANYKTYFSGQEWMTDRGDSSVTYAQAGRALTNAVADSPPIPTSLYRGLEGRRATLSVKDLKPGDDFDILAPTSFTSDETIGQEFARGVAKGQGRKREESEDGVIFEVLPGARGLPVSAISPWDQKEVLTSGKFKVKEVRRNGREPVHVVLEQVSVHRALLTTNSVGGSKEETEVVRLLAKRTRPFPHQF